MTITHDDIKDDPALFRAFTGLDVAEFEELLVAFQEAWNKWWEKNFVVDKERQRKPGGGRKETLDTIEGKLLFIQFYFKTYPLQEVIAFLFGMNQSQACEWIHRLSEVLKMALGRMGHLPERDPEKAEAALADDPENIFAIDGAERRRQRPKDNERQKECDSGKKKTHTIKNNVVVTIKGRKVKYLSGTYGGRKHDKKICDEEGHAFPEGSVLYQDTGYQGYAPEGVDVKQPKRKPRGKELSDEDKERNGLISSVRIVVEHVISGIKRCRIVKDVFRNTKNGFDDLVMEIACGLHNLRTECRTRVRKQAAKT